jgi:large subunit ribosomal protein L30
MILVIRISGMVKVPKKIDETLFRMRLRRKYASIVLEDTNINRKLLKKVRNYVAYGNINEDMKKKLIKLRGQKIKSKDGEIKSFFRLHPPRGGIESKKHFGVGKGVLGDNKEKINELLARML